MDSLIPEGMAFLQAITTIAAVGASGYQSIKSLIEKRRHETANRNICKWFRIKNIENKESAAIVIQRWWRLRCQQSKLSSQNSLISPPFLMVNVISKVKEYVAVMIIEIWWKMFRTEQGNHKPVQKQLCLKRRRGRKLHHIVTKEDKRIHLELRTEIITAGRKTPDLEKRSIEESLKVTPSLQFVEMKLFTEKEKQSTKIIQSWWNGKKKRNEYLNTLSLIINIQALIRSFLIKRNLNIIMTSLKNEVAATFIQDWWKMVRQRRKYLKKKRLSDQLSRITEIRRGSLDSGTPVKNLTREKILSCPYLQVIGDVVNIQAAVKGFLNRKNLVTLIEKLEQFMAAKKIQLWWRVVSVKMKCFHKERRTSCWTYVTEDLLMEGISLEETTSEMETEESVREGSDTEQEVQNYLHDEILETEEEEATLITVQTAVRCLLDWLRLKRSIKKITEIITYIIKEDNDGYL